MDIFLGVMGVIIIILLVILILRKPKIDASSDLKVMDERLIRMEGEVAKLNPAMDRNFRESRKELADSLERMRGVNEKSFEQMRTSNEKSLEQLRTGNEKKLEEMRETVDEKLKASVEKRFNEIDLKL